MRDFINASQETHFYTDGAGSNDNYGCCFIITNLDHTEHFATKIDHIHTPLEAELSAITLALLIVPENSTLHIHSDASQAILILDKILKSTTTFVRSHKIPCLHFAHLLERIIKSNKLTVITHKERRSQDQISLADTMAKLAIKSAKHTIAFQDNYLPNRLHLT